MPQSGQTPIQLYRSATPAAVPAAVNLAAGELAINTIDGNLFFKDSSNVVRLLASTAAATGTVSSVNASGGTTGLTFTGGPITTSGTLTLGGTLALTNGGTGATDAAAARTNLGATTVGSAVFTAVDAAAARAAIGVGTGPGTVTSVGGTGTVNGITLTGTVTNSGNLTLGGTLSGVSLTTQVTGTLPVANGGTGAVTFTANRLLRGNGTSAVSAGSIADFGSGEAVRIDTSGNVGVGTTTPGARFDVVGPALTPATLNTYAMWVANNGGANGDLAFGSDSSFAYIQSFGAKPLRLNSVGTAVVVGALTGSIFSDFTVNGTSGIQAAQPLLNFVNAAGNTRFGYIFHTGAGGTMEILNQQNGPMLFGANNAERMRISATGDVGIGLTNPTERLHVNGNILASGNITAFSDERLKDNVETITKALDKVQHMRGVTYTLKETGEMGTGVIAQEMLTVMPEVVNTNGEYMGVSYGNLVGVLIEAIKELSAEVAELKGKING